MERKGIGMKRELAWLPGFHSDLNHIYDLQTGVAICGSTARMKAYKIPFHDWNETDCRKCIIIEDRTHNEERDAEEVGCCDECDEDDGMNDSYHPYLLACKVLRCDNVATIPGR
jgi:hypothetical protein